MKEDWFGLVNTVLTVKSLLDDDPSLSINKTIKGVK